MDITQATNDLNTIRSWWTMWPDANVAVACGLGGFDVLRVEPRGALNGIERARLLYAAGLVGGCEYVTRLPDGAAEIVFPPASPPHQPVRFDQAGIELRCGADQWVLAPGSTLTAGSVEVVYTSHQPPRPCDLRALAAYVAADPPDLSEPDPNNRAMCVMRDAWRHWADNLTRTDGQWAVDYLQARGAGGITAGVARPAADALRSYLSGRGWTTSDMEQAGLVRTDRRGRSVDRFRDRLVLPLTDHLGRLVGVTGRINPSASARGNTRAPKYLNSPQSELFNKSTVLYGLTSPQAAKLVSRRAVPVIVEGPFDAEAVNAASRARPDPSLPELVGVAPCGTALTRTQLDRLRATPSSYLDWLVIAFDHDDSGLRGQQRAIVELLSARERGTVGIPSQVVGKDPAEWVTHGPDKLYAALFAACPWPQWTLDYCWKQSATEPYMEHKLDWWRTMIGLVATADPVSARVTFEDFNARLASTYPWMREPLAREISTAVGSALDSNDPPGQALTAPTHPATIPPHQPSLPSPPLPGAAPTPATL
jgi:DNA primase catalytic core